MAAASTRAATVAQTPDISLVIPAWNEAERLPRLLESVAVAREGHPGGAGAVEVIVADNGSTDATAAIAEAAGCRVVAVEKRCIAAARNGGAAVARGTVLAFVDADSIVHPGVFAAIDRALADPRTVGGASGVTMERWSVGIALVYALMLAVVWATRFDTGVVFWRRADFEALGGYDESRMLAEDVDWLWRLRRLGKARGQRLVRLRGVKTVTSTRKFDAHGDWHYLMMMPIVAWKLMRGMREAEGFAKKYWYEGR
jgi:glycosyltransferase involved in cell wall biosynthesis